MHPCVPCANRNELGNKALNRYWILWVLIPQSSLTFAEAGQLVYNLQQKATRTP